MLIVIWLYLLLLPNEKKDNIILYNYVTLIFILFLCFVISVVNLKNVLIKQNQLAIFLQYNSNDYNKQNNQNMI